MNGAEDKPHQVRPRVHPAHISFWALPEVVIRFPWIVRPEHRYSQAVGVSKAGSLAGSLYLTAVDRALTIYLPYYIGRNNPRGARSILLYHMGLTEIS